MSVPAREILDWLGSRFPAEWAEEWDRVGLQVGNPDQGVQTLGIALEVTPRTLRWALAEKIQLLVCHHPLFLQPLPHLRTDRDPGKTIGELLRNDLILWVAHTNLDADPEGVSTALAKRLRLEGLEPLTPQGEARYKLVLYIPAGYEEVLQEALRLPRMGELGAYRHCSFSVRGEGRFTPAAKTRPFRGRPGREERVREARLEMTVPQAGIGGVLERIRAVHPYQQMAYDLIPLANRDPGVGLGRLGHYQPPLSWETFVSRVKEGTGTPVLQVGGTIPTQVSRVAVCGGSGRSAIPRALETGAQVLVTGELGYHVLVEFRESPLALMTIGHYVSEKWILPDLALQVKEVARDRAWDLEVKTYLEPGDPYAVTLT